MFTDFSDFLGRSRVVTTGYGSDPRFLGGSYEGSKLPSKLSKSGELRTKILLKACRAAPSATRPGYDHSPWRPLSGGGRRGQLSYVTRAPYWGPLLGPLTRAVFYRFLPIFRTFLGDFNLQTLPRNSMRTTEQNREHSHGT